VTDTLFSTIAPFLDSKVGNGGEVWFLNPLPVPLQPDLEGVQILERGSDLLSLPASAFGTKVMLYDLVASEEISATI
jgi:hypothetical protein